MKFFFIIVFTIILVSRTFQQSDDVTYDQHSVEGPATDESFSEPYENIPEDELLGDEEALVETGSTAEVTDAIHTHEIEEYSDQQNDEASTIKVESKVSEAPQINTDNDQVPTVNKDAEMLNSDLVQELPDVTIEPENLEVESESSAVIGESSEKLDESVQDSEINEHVSKSEDEKNYIVAGNNGLLPPEPQISSDESEKNVEKNLSVTDENSKDSDPNDLLPQEDALGSQEQGEILEDAIIPQADDNIEANINSNEYTNPQELEKQNEEQTKPEEEIIETQHDESIPEDAKTSANENISPQQAAEETQEDASSSQEKVVVGPEEEISEEEIVSSKESEAAQEPAQSSQKDQEESSHVLDEISAQKTENAQIMNEVQEDVANSQKEQEEIDSLKEEVVSPDEQTSTDVGTHKSEDGKEEAAIPHEDNVSPPQEEALNPQEDIVSSQTESDLEEINNVSDNENIKPHEPEKQEEAQLTEKQDEVVTSQEESDTDADENMSPKTTQDDVKIIDKVQDDIASTQREQDDVISPQGPDSERVDTPQDVTSAQQDDLSEETHSETPSSTEEPADSHDVSEADKSDEISSSTIHEALPTTTFIIPYSPQISDRCRDLECEFGYKTDLYGQLLCVCLNPCADNRCGNGICKIIKLSNGSYVGECFDLGSINRPSKCYQLAKPGSCKQYASKFFWNSFQHRCQHFIYTGCNGNENNFETKERCQSECNTCTLPAMKGPCNGNVIRYHYDASRSACVPFSYGGCKGNENNFATKRQCEYTCLSKRESSYWKSRFSQSIK